MEVHKFNVFVRFIRVFASSGYLHHYLFFIASHTAWLPVVRHSTMCVTVSSRGRLWNSHAIDDEAHNNHFEYISNRAKNGRKTPIAPTIYYSHWPDGIQIVDRSPVGSVFECIYIHFYGLYFFFALLHHIWMHTKLIGDFSYLHLHEGVTWKTSTHESTSIPVNLSILFFFLFHFILCLTSLKVFQNLINLQLWLFVRGDRGRFVFKSRASIPRTSGLMCQQRWCSKKQKSSKPKNVYFIYSRMPNLVYYYTHQRPSEHIYYESFSQWINSGTDVSLAR